MLVYFEHIISSVLLCDCHAFPSLSYIPTTHQNKQMQKNCEGQAVQMFLECQCECVVLLSETCSNWYLNFIFPQVLSCRWSCGRGQTKTHPARARAAEEHTQSGIKSPGWVHASIFLSFEDWNVSQATKAAPKGWKQIHYDPLVISHWTPSATDAAPLRSSSNSRRCECWLARCWWHSQLHQSTACLFKEKKGYSMLQQSTPFR